MDIWYVKLYNLKRRQRTYIKERKKNKKKRELHKWSLPEPHCKQEHAIGKRFDSQKGCGGDFAKARLPRTEKKLGEHIDWELTILL